MFELSCDPDPGCQQIVTFHHPTSYSVKTLSNQKQYIFKGKRFLILEPLLPTRQEPTQSDLQIIFNCRFARKPYTLGHGRPVTYPYILAQASLGHGQIVRLSDHGLSIFHIVHGFWFSYKVAINVNTFVDTFCPTLRCCVSFGEECRRS